MGHQLCERARTSGMHRQTEGRMDGELTEQNIERYRERERGGGGGEGGKKNLLKCACNLRRETAEQMEGEDAACLRVRH